MQVESTKKSPGTFSGKRCCRFAMVEITKLHDGVTKEKVQVDLDIKLINQPVYVRSTYVEAPGCRHLVATLSLQRVDNQPLFGRYYRTFQSRFVVRTRTWQYLQHLFWDKFETQRTAITQYH